MYRDQDIIVTNTVLYDNELSLDMKNKQQLSSGSMTNLCDISVDVEGQSEQPITQSSIATRANSNNSNNNLKQMDVPKPVQELTDEQKV